MLKITPANELTAHLIPATQGHYEAHKLTCPECSSTDEDQTFYADLPSYEFFGYEGTMSYHSLGRYALIVWPKGWGKKYDGLYPRFNVLPKLVAAFEFMDHSRYYEPGNKVESKHLF